MYLSAHAMDPSFELQKRNKLSAYNLHYTIAARKLEISSKALYAAWISSYIGLVERQQTFLIFM